ncbi:disintegrin and metalloproteinase domain-containing protein 10 [Acyrthosiphon pisum]|uniref:ADAM10 endopeptidase n=1 Tax=Acyrthosiphon pisum TaxID=7029 RepID=A0A8R2A3H7_ACYPI|nr:disintegrin and metalloproteinase domain-containing protein 10 [Acyrthosiphon pisum]|eukprot:XP_001945603.2 PREDICTED: disintegrin and metalloproteinase domain-containing protein 10 [Acyrthosiphon pisum]
MWPAASPTAFATATTVAVFLTVVVGKFGRISSTPVQQPGKLPTLNHFIKHYTPAEYDRDGLLEQHRRMRRDVTAASNQRLQSPLRLTIATPHRTFKMLLTPDEKLFADDVVFEGSGDRPIPFDPGKAYVGTLEDEETVTVRGIVTSDGLFDGTISTAAEEYFVEPSSRYGDGSVLPYHSVVYRLSDVAGPKSAGGGCRSEAMRERRSADNGHADAERLVNQTYDTEGVILVRSPNGTIVNRSRQSATSKTSVPKPNWYDPNDQRKVLVAVASDEASSNLVVDDSGAYDPFENRKKGLGGFVDNRKTTCMLYLQADHLFYEKYGREETCIEVMTRHVQRVNAIYRNTDFNQDGKPDNISFMIKRVKVHSNPDPTYKFLGNYGVEKFLEIFSEEDYDAFCLAYMFTYRDFEMGTLGLAWTGDLKNAGGVCEKNGHYRGSLKSLNTGIVTLLNYGKHVPSAVSHVTLAHEIGHNFGSPHDPEICTPGGDDGNYIMFARATSGDKKNNNRFSPCSLSAINPVLNVKARSTRGCFTEPQTSICGNGVVEPGEECDCGWEEDCKDACCFPQRRYSPPEEPPCRLTAKSVCSPSQGPCCTNDCNLKIGELCRNDNGCRDASYCNGMTPTCPASINKPNKTVCNEEFVCYMGECTGSICLAYGLESCQCLPTPQDSPTKACELCCKLPGENQPCLSSYSWNNVPYDIPDMYSKPGTPCNDYNGYCDVFQRCREVDPSGPLATLRKLLLSEESIASFKKWAIDHWYYSGLIVASFLLMLVLSTRLFGKRSDPKLKSVTIIHSSTTETVRLPADGDNQNVTVHPAAVRSKLPLKKRVREKRNVNNNNSPAKKSRKNVATEEESTTETSSPKKVGPGAQKKERKTRRKKSKGVIDYSVAQNKVLVTNKKTPEDDPLGKVRNWLLNSHHIEALGGTLRKSKSSPAGFANPPEPPRPVVKAQPKNKDNQVSLQVVYKPPFKFSVKLSKSKPDLTKDKRPDRTKQRAALLIRANRARGGGGGATGAAKQQAKKQQVNNGGSSRVTPQEPKNASAAATATRLQPPEPIYENAAIDLLRMSSTEHDGHQPIFPVAASPPNKQRKSFAGVDAKTDEAPRSKRNSVPQQSLQQPSTSGNSNLMRFPSTENKQQANNNCPAPSNNASSKDEKT